MKKLFILICLLFLPSTMVQAFEEPIAGVTVPIENLQNAQEAIKRDTPIPFIYQIYTYAICREYKVDYEMALSVMDVESEGQANATNHNKNGTVDRGYMQINSVNYQWLNDELGVTDFYNPWQNIKAGVFMLSDLMERHSDTHEILMSYNMGERRTRQLQKKGIYSSAYSRKVMKKYNQLKE
jgi:soluble lytic murein transglycosylase-like protein